MLKYFFMLSKIEVLKIYMVLSEWYISHHEFISINNLLKEYNGIK